MQIQKLSKSLDTLPTTWVRIRFDSEGPERFVITNGVKELFLCVPKPEKISRRLYQTLVGSIIIALN